MQWQQGKIREVWKTCWNSSRFLFNFYLAQIIPSTQISPWEIGNISILGDSDQIIYQKYILNRVSSKLSDDSFKIITNPNNIGVRDLILKHLLSAIMEKKRKTLEAYRWSTHSSVIKRIPDNCNSLPFYRNKLQLLHFYWLIDGKMSVGHRELNDAQTQIENEAIRVNHCISMSLRIYLISFSLSSWKQALPSHLYVVDSNWDERSPSRFRIYLTVRSMLWAHRPRLSVAPR